MIRRTDNKVARTKVRRVNWSTIDPNAIKEIFGDDDDLVAEILAEFAGPAADNVTEILDAWTTRDAAKVGAGAHKLKSSARTVGAHAMADICVELEKAGKAGDMPAIEEHIDRLEPELATVLNYIQNLTLS